MDQLIKQPMQLYINGKYYCTIQECRIEYSGEKSLDPETGQPFSGPKLSIKFAGKRSEADKELTEKDAAQEEYDEWFWRMVKSIDDHDPINLKKPFNDRKR